MRNLFGYAATAIAASAVSFFAAAGFADQHPESVLGQCFQSARSLCMSQQTAAPCTEATPPAPTLCPHDSCLPSACPAITFEPMPSSVSCTRLPGAIVVDETAESEQCEMPEQVRVLMKGLARIEEPKDWNIEVNAPTAPFMPYCEEDEPAPALMPYAEATRSEKESASVFEFWMSFFHMPSSQVTPDRSPDCKEDPAIHQQYPGLTISESRKPGKTKIVPFDEELQEVPPLPMSKPDFKQLLKPLGSQKNHSNLDTTECRPSDFGFDTLGLRPF